MSFKIAAWSEAADRALLVVACNYRWRDVAVRLEREGRQGCTMQACERRFRLLVERERAHRAEHLARLTREPVVETAHTNAIFRERDGGLKPAAREHIDGPDGRGQVVAQVLSPEAMIERAQHNEWKRQLMRKAATLALSPGGSTICCAPVDDRSASDPPCALSQQA